MNSTIDIALFIIVIGMIGILVLYIDLRRLIRVSHTVTIERFVHNYDATALVDWLKGNVELSTIKVVREEGKKTRRRIGQVKTRLADEEKDDQRRKAQARKTHHL